ncbi:unnamed protein product [Hyaloperonospora brassicae]|uniref:Uncharacterized protein n=1 Tax=Hyaloperonospora brassicae TaxID=162125 RepID=A0AAV0TT58_HYABA|nr:unnamed protein product [Hyaloperonospora brassicae]
MHPRSTLSRPSPKRSLSCAGLDNLDELLHTSDNVHPRPNRKRHQSLTSDDDFSTTGFAKPSSPSRHDDVLPPPLSHHESLQRPELLPLTEHSPTSNGYQLIPSSPFESEYTHSSSDHVQVVNHDRNVHSDDRDSNHDENHCEALTNEVGDADTNYSEANERDGNGHVFAPDLAPQEPQDVFEPRLKLDHDIFAARRLDRTMFFQPSLSSSTCECSPREEFLVQAFGPSGFKLHGASVSSNEDLDASLSDYSSSSDSDRNCSLSSHHHGMSGDAADMELKMSCNELEADLRGSMHQNLQYQQHSPRHPEFVEVSHRPSTLSSHSSLGLSCSPSFVRNDQSVHHVSVVSPSQDTQSHLLAPENERKYLQRDLRHESPLRVSPSSRAFPRKGSKEVQTPTKWLSDEDERLRVAVARFGGKNWKMIAETLGNGRTDVQCLHRWNKVLKPGLIKGPWTPEEDGILAGLITRYGIGKIRWCDLALHLPGRIGKQCRERWCNHLDSRIRKGQWTSEEDDMVFCWQQKLGNKWSEIAKLLPGRTENAVKNRFNSAARRKWLMNQANKSSSTAVDQTLLPPSTSGPPFQLHHQQQQHPLLQSSLPHEEGSLYGVGNVLYGGEKVSPLPSSEALLDQHSHKSISPLDHQNFIQHLLPRGTPTTGASLPDHFDHTHPGFGAALDAEGQQTCRQQEPDKPVSMSKTDSTAIASMFPPLPLNALFPPVTASTGIGGGSLGLHHTSTGHEGGGALTTSPFPVAAHFSTPVQYDASVNETAAGKSTTKDISAIKSDDLPLFQPKGEKTERDGLALDRATPDVSAASSVTDSSVSMDDENMSSFLDSVALELDDIME